MLCLYPHTHTTKMILLQKERGSASLIGKESDILKNEIKGQIIFNLSITFHRDILSTFSQHASNICKVKLKSIPLMFVNTIFGTGYQIILKFTSKWVISWIRSATKLLQVERMIYKPILQIMFLLPHQDKRCL